MIKARNNISGKVNNRAKINAKLNYSVYEITPELENLEITPSTVEQVFKSQNYYGYDEVKVKRVESEELNVIPQKEEQVFEGMFNKVTVGPGGDKNATVDGTTFTNNKSNSNQYLLSQIIIELPDNLEISDTNTSLAYMFYRCINLKNVPMINTEKNK